jgi:hypothetical protein
MKIIISESQHKRLFEEEQKVLRIPDFKIFGNDWDILQRFLESKGNPPYSLGGNLDLLGLKVESLGNLVSVEGDIYASETPLKSLGSLTSVGGLMNLNNTPIESLGNLTYVGGDLFLINTPMSNTWLQIKQMINKVGGDIYFE